MFSGKTFLAIIPARGGSKGIPRKNIRPLAGKPLIAWTIEAAKRSLYIDRVILSTEDDEIMETARNWGCEVPFRRPVELALDDTPGVDPIIHAMETVREKYDYIILLQPTSPLRTSQHIDSAIEKLVIDDGVSLVSFCKVNKSPEWMYRITDSGEVTPFIKSEERISRRQDLTRLYIPNGALYIAKSDFIVNQRTFFCTKTLAYIMDEKSSVDIDNAWDWEMAERMIK